MKTRIGIILVVLFATLPFYWDKTREAGYPVVAESDNPEDLLPPLVLATSLYDSLPGNVVDMLGLGSVQGTKIKYRNGSFASYYHYSADRQKLLSAFALMPMPIRDKIADTSYRTMSLDELRALNTTLPFSEFAYDEGFWSASPEHFDVIESIKPPFRHLLLLSKSGHRVLHRVTPLI